MKDLINYLTIKKEEAFYRLEKLDSLREEALNDSLFNEEILKDIAFENLRDEANILIEFIDAEVEKLLQSDSSYFYYRDTLNYFEEKISYFDSIHKQLLDETQIFIDEKSHNKSIAKELFDKQRNNLMILDFLYECKRNIYSGFLFEVSDVRVS